MPLSEAEPEPPRESTTLHRAGFGFQQTRRSSRELSPQDQLAHQAAHAAQLLWLTEQLEAAMSRAREDDGGSPYAMRLSVRDERTRADHYQGHAHSFELSDANDLTPLFIGSLKRRPSWGGRATAPAGGRRKPRRWRRVIRVELFRPRRKPPQMPRVPPTPPTAAPQYA